MSLLKRPELLLKYFVGYLAVFLVSILVLTIAWSQFLHWGSEWFEGGYSGRQKVYYQFVCRPQIGPKTPRSVSTQQIGSKTSKSDVEEQNGSETPTQVGDKKNGSKDPVPIDSQQIRHRYFALMEVARQEVSPTDFVGKFQRFILCANFSGAGVGPVQLAATGSGSFFFDEMHIEEAQIRLNEFKAITTRYPDVPNYLKEEINCLLSEMAQGKQELSDIDCTVDSEESPGDPPKGGPGPWILISGADQSDDGALNEVKASKSVLAGTQGVGATEVFLIRSWRRTVTYYDDKDNAEAALKNKKSSLRYGGYIRNTAKWCNGIPTEYEREIDEVKFWRCQS